MEQINNGILQMLQVMSERTATKPVEQSKGSHEFRKLMEQQEATHSENHKKTPEDLAPEPQEQSAVMEEPELQAQMVVAAMMMLQRPVVPMEQTLVVEPMQQEIPQQVVEALPADVAQITASPVMKQSQQIAEVPAEVLNQVEQTPVEFERPQSGTVLETGSLETVMTRQTDQKKQPEVIVKTVETAEVDTGAKQRGPKQENLPVEAETTLFKNVREIPVKVGEAPIAEEAVQTVAVPVEQQIGEKLAEALQNGESRVEIQLTPENLGRVSVEMTWSSDGALRVAIHTESSQTRSLLEQDSTSLMQALSRHTQEDVQVLVTTRQQENQQQAFYDDQQGQGRQREQNQQRQDQQHTEQDFLQQLRLGMVSLDGEAS